MSFCAVKQGCSNSLTPKIWSNDAMAHIFDNSTDVLLIYKRFKTRPVNGVITQKTNLQYFSVRCFKNSLQQSVFIFQRNFYSLSFAFKINMFRAWIPDSCNRNFSKGTDFSFEF